MDPISASIATKIGAEAVKGAAVNTAATKAVTATVGTLAVDHARVHIIKVMLESCAPKRE